jgi:TRAP-type C4-dicarboxylate transport system permease small subunit
MAVIPPETARVAWRTLSYVLLGGAATLLFGMMAVTFVDVIARYFLNSPMPAAFELNKIMLGMLIFACLPLLSIKRMHVTIDLLDAVLPQRMHDARIRVVDLLGAFVLAVMGIVVWIQAGKLADSNVGTEVLRVPIAPIAYFMSAMLCVAALLSVLKSIGRETGEEDAGPETYQVDR